MSEEKVAKNVIINEENYIKAKDLTAEDKNNMDDVVVLLQVNVNKKRNTKTFISKIRVHKDLVLSNMITENQYNWIIRKYKLDSTKQEHLIKCKIRFIMANENVDNKWIRYELYICSGLDIKKFLSDSSEKYLFLDLLKNNEVNYKIHLSQDIYSDEEIYGNIFED